MLISSENYDSEGELPYHDEQALDEDAEEWGEDAIGCCPALPPLAAGPDPPVENPVEAPNIITENDVMAMTVAILKGELRKKGQSTSGTKSPLQKREKEEKEEMDDKDEKDM